MPPGFFKPLAWNGVSLAVPRDWDPADLQACAMRAWGESGPVLDLRWRRVAEDFDAGQYLAHTARELGGVVVTDPAALPPGWDEARTALQESGVQALPYAWNGAQAGAGAGAVLHTPDSGRAALARFTFHGEADAELARTVLCSYRSHPAESLVPWSAFGVRALVPGTMELHNFSFNPGHFRLYFSSGRGRGRSELVLDRLGPADALLGRRTLAQYADVFYGTLGAPDGFFTEDGGPDAVSGEMADAAPLLSRLLDRPAYPHARGRLWRAGIGAMLLGAYMRGPHADALAPFDAVCDGYDLVRA